VAAGAARPRLAGAADAPAAGRLLHRFNSEYDEPTPGPEPLGRRIAELIATGATEVLLAGAGPDGILVVRFQPGIWTDGAEAYIAELYVVPERRQEGLGGALMEKTLTRCRERGVDYIFLGTDEGDADAHRLYERHGFSNLTDPSVARAERERMLVYEREL